MKKLVIVLVVATAATSLTGCQRCFRMRGARCCTTGMFAPAAAPVAAPVAVPAAVPATVYPSTTCSSPPATYAPMTTTSSASAFSPSSSATCCPEGEASEPVVVQEFPTSPIMESDGQVVKRPYVVGSPTYIGGSETTATSIPGPETAPVPAASN